MQKIFASGLGTGPRVWGRVPFFGPDPFAWGWIPWLGRSSRSRYQLLHQAKGKGRMISPGAPVAVFQMDDRGIPLFSGTV